MEPSSKEPPAAALSVLEKRKIKTEPSDEPSLKKPKQEEREEKQEAYVTTEASCRELKIANDELKSEHARLSERLEEGLVESNAIKAETDNWRARLERLKQDYQALSEENKSLEHAVVRLKYFDVNGKVKGYEPKTAPDSNNGIAPNKLTRAQKRRDCRLKANAFRKMTNQMENVNQRLAREDGGKSPNHRSFPKKKCPICEVGSPKYILKECGHCFCGSCIAGLVQVASINEALEMTVPCIRCGPGKYGGKPLLLINN